MARKPSAQPTEVELEILHVLWTQGPCVLGDIHRILAAQRNTAYSSTRKMVQVMCEKGILLANDSVRPQQYRAALSREKTQKGLLNDLAARVFGGSTQKLVLSALSNEQLSSEELGEIQKLIKGAKEKTK
ncbi:MAG: BlaI/MecI/CopY family transcriptional regulator [Verrucomicrobiota bacterium]